MIDGVASWLTDVVATAGYPGVALVVLVETLVPPLAGPILPMIGVIATTQEMSLPGTIAAATTGSMVGAWIMYGAAWKVGPERVREFICGHRRLFHADEADLDRAEAWFDSHADRAVSIGRCIPLVRSLVSLPAGFRRMTFIRFSLLSALGCAAWNTALILAGAAMTPSWRRLQDLTSSAQLALLVLAGLLGVVALGRHLARRRRSER